MRQPNRRLRLLAFCAVLAPVCAWSELEKDSRPGPEALSEEYAGHLDEVLGLDAGQRKAIDAILEKARPEVGKQVDEIRGVEKKLEGLREQAEKSLRALHERIREKLNDEQKEKFDRMRLEARGSWTFPREGPGMRGIEYDPDELPPEVLDRLRHRLKPDVYPLKPEMFPPERWAPSKDMPEGKDLPPELRQHIERRLKERGPAEGMQKDVPPPGQWNDGAWPQPEQHK